MRRAALTAVLLDLPVDNWPILGGMGNASWVQLSGHSAVDADLAEVKWRLDVWNASALVFLFDPLRFDGVYKKLPPEVLASTQAPSLQM